MSDDISSTEDDTTGHVLHGEAAEHPVSGGRAPGLARLGLDEDDVQGHRAARAAGDDDVEGHRVDRRIARSAGDEDDTEGHRLVL